MDAAAVAAAATPEASPPGASGRKMTTAEKDKYARVLYKRREMANASKLAAAHAKGSKAAFNSGPIERPVVLCLDNHSSRYSEELLLEAEQIAAEQIEAEQIAAVCGAERPVIPNPRCVLNSNETAGRRASKKARTL